MCSGVTRCNVVEFKIDFTEWFYNFYILFGETISIEECFSWILSEKNYFDYQNENHFEKNTKKNKKWQNPVDFPSQKMNFCKPNVDHAKKKVEHNFVQYS